MGNTIFIITFFTCCTLLFLFTASVFLAADQYRRNKKLLRELRLKEAGFQKQLANARFDAQEHTFRIVGQDIHDNVGQLLSLAQLNLNIALQLENGPERLHEVKTYIANAITELRNLGTAYHADQIVEKGLCNAIREQLHQLEKTGMFTTSFISSSSHLHMERSRTVFLYRIIQEALCNVMKHSGGNHVAIQLYRHKTTTHLILTDNGDGFDIHSNDFKPGAGLASMRQRAAMINAQFEITSNKGTGTVIQLTW